MLLNHHTSSTLLRRPFLLLRSLHHSKDGFTYYRSKSTVSIRDDAGSLPKSMPMAAPTTLSGHSGDSSAAHKTSALRDNLRNHVRRLLSLPARIVVGSIVYPIALFWALFVVVKESLVFLRAPLRYFQVKSRPFPDVLRPTVQQRHKRAHLPNGISLHYVEQGDFTKPMILFLHGFPEFWYSWRHQLAALSADYYCVAVDMRGYGDSSKPGEISDYIVEELVNDFVLLMDQLGKQKCTIVAHDWGGSLAWSFAMAHANKLDRLVVINCPHPQTIFGHGDFRQYLRSWYIFFFQLPWLPELIMWRRDLQSMDVLMKSAGLSAVDVEAFKYTYGQPHAFEFPINYYRANVKGRIAAKLGLSRFFFVTDSNKKAESRSNRRMSLKNQNPKLPASLPTLMIWGADDKFLIQKFAEIGGDYCENYRYVIVPDAGHFVQQERPIEVNSLIEQFMRGNEVSVKSQL